MFIGTNPNKDGLAPGQAIISFGPIFLVNINLGEIAEGFGLMSGGPNLLPIGIALPVHTGCPAPIAPAHIDIGQIKADGILAIDIAYFLSNAQTFVKDITGLGPVPLIEVSDPQVDVGRNLAGPILNLLVKLDTFLAKMDNQVKIAS